MHTHGTTWHPKRNVLQLLSAEISKWTHNFKAQANEMKCTRNFGCKVCGEDTNWGNPGHDQDTTGSRLDSVDIYFVRDLPTVLNPGEPPNLCTHTLSNFPMLPHAQLLASFYSLDLVFRIFSRSTNKFSTRLRLFTMTIFKVSLRCTHLLRAKQGGAVGRGTALQVTRSQAPFPMVPLEFFIGITLPATLWPWGPLNL